ncbi:uncharacterized protein MKK02DRAFT_43123 [Dioszegia hungarica]|uniref:Uncharacterized protein n=1 Tax=Dioszegia hungarica TaxID=4972 RepID=A0AA38HCJ2_9TREE|nr:uncharacterized protein MKK02DRAFT_43123 [Dioszegia hungarica]KAI9637204.1 hypothetical protein MKK02DRAFT_43123 [Dioszegia hungarica]
MLPQTATAALFSLLSFLVLKASARAPTVLTVTADGRDTSKWVEYRLPEIGNGVAHELKFEFKENHFNLLEWTNFDTKETKKGPFLAGDGHFTAKTFGPKGTPNCHFEKQDAGPDEDHTIRFARGIDSYLWPCQFVNGYAMVCEGGKGKAASCDPKAWPEPALPAGPPK